MANVTVKVLMPFGDFSVGEASVEESRLAYLEKRGLVEKIKPHSLGKTHKLDENDLKLNESVGVIGVQLGCEREQGEKIPDFLDRLALFLTKDLVDDSSDQLTQGSVTKDAAIDMATQFRKFLDEKFNEATFVEVALEKYPTADDILSAPNNDLVALQHIGPSSALRLKTAAEEFLSNLSPEKSDPTDEDNTEDGNGV